MEAAKARTTTGQVIASLPKLLAVAVGLPAIIVFVDQLAIGALPYSQVVFLLPILFVAQVAVLGICAGRFLDNVFVRCVVFCWSIALVNSVALATIFFGHGTTLQCMTFAFVTGQVGLLTTWGILGRMPWPWRTPILLVTLALTAIVLIRSGPWLNDSGMWAVILIIQSGVMMVLCMLMRFAGYRLLHMATSQQDAPELKVEHFQFSNRHLMLWMAAICPVLALARGIDWLYMDSQALFRTAILGLALAIISWSAMLASIGTGSRLVRLSMLVIVAPIVGMSLMWLSSGWNATWNSNSSARFFRDFKELGWMWVAWTVLAAWFLASLLQVFRSAGYRLARARIG